MTQPHQPPYEPEELELLAVDPMPSIVCPCGFTVRGTNEEANADAFGRHACPNDPRQENAGFWDLFFSGGTFWALVVICWTVLVALGKVWR